MNEQAEIITCPCCGQEAPEMGNISFDPSTNQVFYGDHSLQVTASQFKVLTFLLAARGQIKSKDSIFDHLYWDRIADGDFPDEKIIDVYVCKLRPKLRAIGLNILTEWGVGYRLVETESQHDL